MAKDIIKQAEPHIREIVYICCVLKAKGRGLDELNDFMGQISKFREHSQPFTKGTH